VEKLAETVDDRAHSVGNSTVPNFAQISLLQGVARPRRSRVELSYANPQGEAGSDGNRGSAR
jgi:hypothetical protein